MFLEDGWKVKEWLDYPIYIKGMPKGTQKELEAQYFARYVQRSRALIAVVLMEAWTYSFTEEFARDVCGMSVQEMSDKAFRNNDFYEEVKKKAPRNELVYLHMESKGHQENYMWNLKRNMEGIPSLARDEKWKDGQIAKARFANFFA